MQATETEKTDTSRQAPPFLKWAGGKRWLIERHLSLIPQFSGRYIEPFLGSGAVFFSLRPKKAILADLNADLIRTYSSIKSDPAEVERLLKLYHEKHTETYYYDVREKRFSDDHAHAAHFIYLNRTCWNGLYRVNKLGVFNVPIGTKTSVVLATDDFAGIAAGLKSATLKVSDFEKTIDLAEAGDLVFADPPYTVKHNNNGFVKYNQKIFSWEDQLRLSQALIRAKKRGAKVLCTNADHNSLRELYRSDFSLKVISRASVISGKAEHRGPTTEIAITG